MTNWLVPIIVAIIMGPMVVLMKRFDRRNSAQHGASMDKLDRIDGKLDTLTDKVHDHITDRRSHR